MLFHPQRPSVHSILDKTHEVSEGRLICGSMYVSTYRNKPAVMKVWMMIQAAIYFESVNPILMIVLKKNVSKKVDFLKGMSKKVATLSTM